MVTREFVESRIWKFFHASGTVASEFFKFLPNGNIGNYNNVNETSWRIDDGGILCLLNDKGEITTRFDITLPDSERKLLSGYFRGQKHLQLFLQEQTSAWPKEPGLRARFVSEIRNRGWEIGDHSYGDLTVVEAGYGNLKVGKYTSIAAGVTVSLADHRMDTVSTYPFVTLKKYWPAIRSETDHHSKGDVSIGNDVWIGTGAFITSGVAIGDGAVIGAKSVVTHDVAPYSVVAGVPAKPIRMRFQPNVIDCLLKIRWWDWDDNTVNSRLDLILNNDIGHFLERFKIG